MMKQKLWLSILLGVGLSLSGCNLLDQVMGEETEEEEDRNGGSNNQDDVSTLYHTHNLKL
jgi:hypothetical protein